ncbi:MAG: 4Fe-4S binding protein [Desulfobacterales bacterium]|jgi:Pyruvate/2-oxoacid:ferredoxin oxidoreductase delta subunit
MTSNVYQKLFEVMKTRRGPYTGIDIPEFYDLVQELFNPEEAAVNNAMSRKPATAGEIAKAMGKPEDEISATLETMADRGLTKTFFKDGVRYFQGEIFMPGIFEYQFMSGGTTEREKKIARLIHTYKKAFNAAKGEVKMTFPTSRVITVDRTIDAGNTVHTYDQVSTYIDKNDTIAVGTCYCRHTAKLMGEDTHDMPLDVCMWFGNMAAYAIERLNARQMTKQEAMQVLDHSESAGLVHMSRNTTENIDFICNCDRWHCDVISSVLKQSKPAIFFNSGFQPQFDPDLCTACETCIERCPPEALTMGDNDVPQVNLDRCFGCAVCATGCPSEAISMVAKSDFPVPPKDPRELVTALKASFAAKD